MKTLLQPVLRTGAALLMLLPTFAAADLLGVVPGNPNFLTDQTGSLTYSAGSDLLSADSPVANVQLNPGEVRIPIANGNVAIRFFVDSTGAVTGGVPGDDLQLTGELDVDGDTVPDYSGVLLRGEILDFGYFDFGTNTFVDFRFRATGGSIQPLIGADDIGIAGSSEGSSFAGSFNVSFGGGNFKVNIGPIPPQPRPNIRIEKATNTVDADDPNAGDAPQIVPGGAVNWTYVVTNTGNVTLNNVTVVDDQGVSVSCPKTTLAPAESMTCTASGLAEDLNNTTFTTVPGLCGGFPQTPLYENMGKATGQTAAGAFVEDDDPSHYCNPPRPNIRIEKATNTVDADDPNAGDAPQIVPGGAVNWTYVVTNTGNVTLNNVTVVDDQGVSVSCPKTTLAPAESMTCTASGLAEDLNNTTFTTVPGLCGGFPQTPLYENMGKATGQTAAGAFVEDDDPSHYCNPPAASLGDYVWEDKNLDGIQNDGETGINGVTVELGTFANGVCTGTGTTTTTAAGGPNDQSADPNGYYEFTGLEPGDYCVIFTKPADYCADTYPIVGGEPTFSTPNATGDALDSDANPTTGATGQITLVAGQNDPTNDAGIYCPAKVGDFVWLDKDLDGKQGPNEPGVDNVVVNLKDENGTVIRTMNTFNNGMYMFGGPSDPLPPGTYSVQCVKPDGFDFTTQDVGGNGFDAIDSDANPTNGMTHQTTLDSGEYDDTLDCGLIAPVLCELEVDKTCAIYTRPPGDDECTSQIASTTLRYTGPDLSDVDVKFNPKRKGQSTVVYSGVDLESGVTVLTMPSEADFTIDTFPDGIGAKMTIKIKDGGKTLIEEVIHTSCSTPYLVGAPAPLDGQSPGASTGDPSPTWFVVNFVDKSGNGSGLSGPVDPDFTDSCTIAENQTGADVTYRYDVTNVSNSVVVTDVGVIDNVLGEIPGSPIDSIDPGDTVTLEETVFVDATVTNTVTVTGVPRNGTTECTATDEVTVTKEPPAGGTQGCTPGYWKQSQHFGSWVGFDQDDDFEAVFGVDASQDWTLLEALKQGGGGENALARHAVAALLNASNSEVDYFASVAMVIAIVQDAYATGEFEPVKNLLDFENNRGCPLGRNP